STDAVRRGRSSPEADDSRQTLLNHDEEADLRCADRASLLTALVLGAVREFASDLVWSPGAGRADRDPRRGPTRLRRRGRGGVCGISLAKRRYSGAPRRAPARALAMDHRRGPDSKENQVTIRRAAGRSSVTLAPWSPPETRAHARAGTKPAEVSPADAPVSC